MIILAAWVAGCTILFPIITIKGKPIIHTAIPITTIQVVPGIHPIIDTTTIRTLIAIIGIHTLTKAVTGGLDKLCWENMKMIGQKGDFTQKADLVFAGGQLKKRKA